MIPPLSVALQRNILLCMVQFNLWLSLFCCSMRVTKVGMIFLEAATSVPKKRIDMNEASGDLPDAFTEVRQSWRTLQNSLNGYYYINLIYSYFVYCRSRLPSLFLNTQPLRPTLSLMYQLNLLLRLQMRPWKINRKRNIRNLRSLKPHLSQLGRYTSTKKVGWNQICM